jgi:hypothetical protein
MARHRGATFMKLGRAAAMRKIFLGTANPLFPVVVGALRFQSEALRSTGRG